LNCILKVGTFVVCKFYLKVDILKSSAELGAYNPSYSGGKRSGGLQFEAILGKQFTRLKKSPSQKRAGGACPEFKLQY
jgi:hypothetical protein